MKEKIMLELLKLTKKAAKKEEVPIACLITHNDKLLVSETNSKNKTNSPIGHAEINCIIKATKKLKTWILDECEMYVTLYPCKMCQEVIKECRIKKVHYILDQNKTVNSKTIYIKEDCSFNDEFKSELSNFFKNKR